MAKDERLQEESLFFKLLKRPEFTAVAGAIAVFIVFFVIADDSMFSMEGTLSWVEQSALIGILAVGVALLMIGGEFDLSIGSMIGFAGMTIAILTVQYGVPAWIAILAAFAVAIGVGFVNGYIVIKTKLPSFIVTLASLFILRGLTIALSRILTNQTLVGGISDAAKGDWLAPLFGGVAFRGLFIKLADMGWIEKFPDGTPVVQGIKMVIIWWIVLTIIGMIVLRATKYGNWIYATGGDEQAAKNMGVPTDKVKIALFIGTAVVATIFAACQVFDYGSADAQRGLLKEFEAIIAVVMGGTLLTGGYGTVVGASLGAIIFGIVNIGISYTQIDSDWFRVFLGFMLLGAVMLSNSIRKAVMKG